MKIGNSTRTTPIVATCLYSEFQAELLEIERHKWLLSEQKGLDVGFEYALTDWVRNHRKPWREQRQMKALK